MSEKEKTLVALKAEFDSGSEKDQHCKERFEALVRVTPAIFWNLDADGRLIHEPADWHHYTGLTPEECNGAGWMAAIHPDDRQPMIEAWRAAMGRGTFYEATYRLRRRDGQYRQVRACGVPLLGRDGKVREWVGTIADIQDFKLAQKSEEQLRIAVEAAGMATWDWDTTADLITWGGHQPGWFRLERGTQPRTYAEFENLIHPEDRPVTRAKLLEAVEKGTEYHAEFRIMLPDGTTHWLEGHGSVLQQKESRSTHLLGVFKEATARKEVETAFLRAHAQLEERVHARTAELAKAIKALRAEALERQEAEQARGELFGMLVTAEEDERRRMSRDLHDHMGQYLTAMALELKALQQTLPDREDIQRRLKNLQNFTVEVGQEVHRIAMALRPTALDDLGLRRTLINHLEDIAATASLSVDYHLSGLEAVSIPSEIETTLFRFVQEALNNVTKHAAASRVNLILTAKPASVLAIVEDNGKGFSVEQYLKRSNPRERLGLRGMKERILLLGGNFQLESKEGQGTTVFLRIPLRALNQGGNNE